MNTITPRIFVAATQQNDGKTTTAVGLFAALRERLGRIGFIKPVGQRFVEIEGNKIDEDTVLIDQTFGVKTPLEAMSPIAIEPDFTRKYIENANHDFFVKRLQNSFDRAAWEKDFMIIEGSGHAGVGSVFDLSNARVASLLGSKVILVTRGGIGRAIDEAALNKALFDKEGVELIGVVINKVLPEKFEYIQDIVGRGLGRLGIELLGCIPVEPILGHATLGQVTKEVDGQFIAGKNFGRRLVRKVIIGAMNSHHVTEYFQHGTLVVTPGDREDIILAAISACAPGYGSKALTGLVLSGNLEPHPNVIEMIHNSNLPVITSPLDSYTVAHAIHNMTVKTLPGDHEKIEKIQSLIATHINIDRLLERL
ncbi:MAG: AAA family ATPase [Verrucomicrobiota bacterium]